MTKALVVGAGVGGLTAAVALARVGVDVEVFERAPDPGRILVGGGLHVWPNGTRAFAELGLSERMRAVGATIATLEWHTPRGGILATADLAATARKVGAPSIGIRRADLLSVLLEAAGEDRIRFGAEVAAFQQDDDGVAIRFADGVAHGDVLIAADGLQSVVRERLVEADELRKPGVLVCQGAAQLIPSLPPAVFTRCGRRRSASAATRSATASTGSRSCVHPRPARSRPTRTPS